MALLDDELVVRVVVVPRAVPLAEELVVATTRVLLEVGRCAEVRVPEEAPGAALLVVACGGNGSTCHGISDVFFYLMENIMLAS